MAGSADVLRFIVDKLNERPFDKGLSLVGRPPARVARATGLRAMTRDVALACRLLVLHARTALGVCALSL